jgi:hypothetical protein
LRQLHLLELGLPSRGCRFLVPQQGAAFKLLGLDLRLLLFELGQEKGDVGLVYSHNFCILPQACPVIAFGRAAFVAMSNSFWTVFMILFQRAVKQFLIASTLSLLAITAVGLSGCDYVAQKELQVGASSKDDVLVKMGKPTMIWEEKDGSALYEYPRGPEGHVTYMVKIAADGKYMGMDNILIESNFNKVVAGMTRDDIRRQLGKPTETSILQLKKEEMWTWRYMRNNSESRRFHVMMDPEGKVIRTEYSDDPKKQGNG